MFLMTVSHWFMSVSQLLGTAKLVTSGKYSVKKVILSLLERS